MIKVHTDSIVCLGYTNRQQRLPVQI